MTSWSQRIGALATLVLLGTSFHSSAQYTITDLNDPQATEGTQPRAISGNEIVGDYSTLSGSFGFTYDGGTYTTLVDPSGYETYASGISGSNIVGSFENPALGGVYSAYLYNGSTFTTLNDPSATTGTFGYGVSGNNVVGMYGNLYGEHGFLYNGSTFTTLDDPLAKAGEENGTFAAGISGNEIVGTYTDAKGIDHGFLFNGTTYATINVPMADETTSGSAGTEISGISGIMHLTHR